jgi:tetratricopeptide (TPR) repeat protein
MQGPDSASGLEDEWSLDPNLESVADESEEHSLDQSLTLAKGYMAAGQYRKAESLVEGASAIAANEGRYGDMAHLTAMLGHIYVSEQRYSDAASSYALAIADGVRAFGSQDYRLADFHAGLGHSYAYLARYADAAWHYNQAVALLEGTPSGSASDGLEETYAQFGRDVEELLMMAEHDLGRSGEELVAILQILGRIYRRQAQHIACRKVYGRALGILLSLCEGIDPRIPVVLQNMAEASLCEDKFAQALTLYRQALTLARDVCKLDLVTITTIARRYQTLREIAHEKPYKEFKHPPHTLYAPASDHGETAE